MNLPRLVIASPASGSGKTTLTAILAAACRAQKLSVQPFKVGPDYIDPTHLAEAAGRTARNLDGFFLKPAELIELFRRGAKGAELSLIEGVMGLFDGKDSLGRIGSTAQIAKLLKAPVVLVVDAAAMAGSIAPLARGFWQHDPELKLAGVIANRVGSARHAQMLRQSLSAVGLRFFGYLPHAADLALPERHLGLVLAGEVRMEPEKLVRYAKTLDLRGLLSLARQAPPLPSPPHQFPAAHKRARACLAVAQDRAFSFYYPEALELLEMLGAEIVPFSPLEETRLPPKASAVWLGGGYPELYAEELSKNRGMKRAISRFRGPVLAECGGYMYLSEALVTSEASFPMVGLVPAKARLEQRPILGYRKVKALADSPVAKKGWVLKGHEFHYATMPPSSSPAWQDPRKKEGLEGFARGKIIASFLHLYFPAYPKVARRFIQQAEEARKRA